MGWDFPGVLLFSHRTLSASDSQLLVAIYFGIGTDKRRSVDLTVEVPVDLAQGAGEKLHCSQAHQRKG
jgi:hypothetical protein